MINQTLNNRYKIISRLGKGAMGTVYLATDTQSNREVALKIISSDLAIESDMLERLAYGCFASMQYQALG